MELVSTKLWYLWSAMPCCPLSKQQHKQETHFDKSLETRHTLVMAAFNEMYERGFQASSISNILKNTGITKGALYHHFKNKQELGYAVLDEVIRDTIRDIWIKPLTKTDDPITVLKSIIIQSGKDITEENIALGCPLNNLAQEMSPIDKGFKDRISAIYTEWQSAIEDASERGKKAGNVIHSIDSKDMSLLFIASLQGILGLAKSVQNINTLISCGQGLIDRLESLRPLKKSIIKAH